MTRTAIETFIRQEFGGFEISDPTDRAQALARRADGVFLWAQIAVRNVLRGLDSNATDQELKQRIERLPRGMENLYKEMLGRVEEDWPLVRQEAALLFSTALLLTSTGVGFGPHETHRPSNSGYLYQYNAAMGILSSRRPTLDEFESLEQDCNRLKDGILFVCAGMLEVEMPRAEQVQQAPRSMAFATVEFTHRTAKDFLLDTPFGRRLIDLDAWNPVSVVREMIRVECLLFRSNLREIDWFSICRMLLTITEIQRTYNTDDAACLEMVLSVRELLTAVNPSESQHLPLSIEFLNQRRVLTYGVNDFLSSSDFVGLTLEVGMIYYFDSLSLTLEHLTAEYTEYLLFCAAAQYRFCSLEFTTRPVYYNFWKILRRYGAHGTKAFWLSNMIGGQRVMHYRHTANELLLSEILWAVLEESKDHILFALEWLDESTSRINDTFSFWLASNGSVGKYEQRRLLARLAGNKASILFVEGNLKFWLALIHSYLERPEQQNPLTQIMEKYQMVATFRRLRFVMTRPEEPGVPIFRRGQLAMEAEDGETLLRLWEASTREPPGPEYFLLPETARGHIPFT